MNAAIIEQFNKLIAQIQAEYLNAEVEGNTKDISNNKFRLSAVKKSLAAIKKLDFEITNEADIKGISGIGPGTIRRVKEILETGHLSEIESKYGKSKQNKINSIMELGQVIGIGNKLAKKLVVENKIANIDSLRKAIDSGKLHVNDKILLGLKYYGTVKGNIPRKEITLTERYLTQIAKNINPDLTTMICGSYRRGKPTSGDIDVLMYHPLVKFSNYITNPSRYNLEPYLILFVDKLVDNKFLLDHLTDKNYHSKYMGFCQYKNNPVRRIDIRFVPYNSIYTAMLYFTGPHELNTMMRTRAKKRQMILNEYGLYKVDLNGNKHQLPITSEADVFKYLGMEYLTPEKRESFSIGKMK